MSGRPDSPRILLVEDDRTLAGMLEEILRSAGYVVETAYDGQLGLHLGLSRSYDVMVLDRGLPAIEGLDLLGRLRSRGVVTPVLVLSALGLARDRVDGLDAGAEDYLSKPFDIDELLARLRALLRRHHDRADDLVGARRTPGGLDPHRHHRRRGEHVPVRPRVRTAGHAGPSTEPASSPGPSWSPPSSPTPTTRAWSTPTSTTCAASCPADAIRTVRGLGYQLGSGRSDRPVMTGPS